MIKRICKHCNKEYLTFESVKPSYCSRKCANEAKKKGISIYCLQCGKQSWKPISQPGKRFCSHSCAKTFYNLTKNNPAFTRNISGENNPMFGIRKKGIDNPSYGKTKELSSRWGGGIKHRPDGYIRVVVPEQYPSPCEIKPSGTKYALEHRVVVEKSIGRYLTKIEEVHHKDSNPSNNKIDNLILCKDHADHMKYHKK